MDERPYSIAADPSRHLLGIHFATVFWSLDVADRFRTDCLAAVAMLRCAPGQHLILVDLRNAVLQSQDVIEKMKALVGIATARRIALIAESPLARMQTKRLQLRDNVVLFGTLEDAEAWLFTEQARAA